MQTDLPRVGTDRGPRLSGAFVLLLVIVLFAGLYRVAEGWYWWTVDDWGQAFRPAALNLHNPYTASKFAATYPPWFFWLLYPLAVLPAYLGHAILTVASLLVLAVYLKDRWRVLLLVLSTPVLVTLFYGHPDALLVSAFMLPVDMSLIVVSCKPMVLLGWVARKWLASKRPLWHMTPFITVLLVSLAIYPQWPVDLASTLGGLNSVDSMPLAWPMMIPVGLLLLLTDDERLWLVGSLFLTPYLQRYHLTPLLAYFYKREKWPVLVVVTVVTWIWTWYAGF